MAKCLIIRDTDEKEDCQTISSIIFINETN